MLGAFPCLAGPLLVLDVPLPRPTLASMDIAYTTKLPTADVFRSILDSTGWYPQGPPPSDLLAQSLGGTWYAVSAYDGDRLVGFGRIISDGAIHALIADLIVRPAYQRRGIGSALLEQLLTRCRAGGIHSVQLFCANGKAAFYERHGFVRRTDSAPGMDWRGQ